MPQQADVAANGAPVCDEVVSQDLGPTDACCNAMPLFHVGGIMRCVLSPVLSGGEAGFHDIQGIGAGFVPANLHRGAFDRIVAVDDEAAISMSRKLAKEEGLLVGISSGANCVAALEIARELGEGKIVLTIFCDTGERYLTTDLFRESEQK